MPKKQKIQVTLPETITIDTERKKEGYTVQVQMHGFRLSEGYVVIDWFIEGYSYKNELWFTHLTPPKDGHFKRSNVLVPITRHARFENINLTQPLWKNKVDKEHMIDLWMKKISKQDPDIVAALAIMKDKNKTTQKKYASLYSLLNN